MQPITASGVVVLSIEAGDGAVVANTALTITLDELVHVLVAGMGGGATATVASGDAAVRRHWHRLLLTMVAARAAHERRTRPVEPVLRERVHPARGYDRLPHGRRLCPHCGNRPGEVDVCGTCDGLGLVRTEDQP